MFYTWLSAFLLFLTFYVYVDRQPTRRPPPADRPPPCTHLVYTPPVHTPRVHPSTAGPLHRTQHRPERHPERARTAKGPT